MRVDQAGSDQHPASIDDLIDLAGEGAGTPNEDDLVPLDDDHSIVEDAMLALLKGDDDPGLDPRPPARHQLSLLNHRLCMRCAHRILRIARS